MPKCLVVSESATLRRVLRNQLRVLGQEEIFEANNGRQALDRCDGTIRLIVTDWNMPVLGGLELAKHLRSNPATSRIPILMVSSRNARSDVTAAIEAGVDDYILKPFTSETLKSKLEALLRGDAGEEAPKAAAA